MAALVPMFGVGVLSMTSDLIFGTIDGEPFVLARGPGWIKAWSLKADSEAWAPTSPAVVSMDGRVLSKAAFDAKFPSLPPLPSKAFHLGPRLGQEMEEILDRYLLEAIEAAQAHPPKPPYRPKSAKAPARSPTDSEAQAMWDRDLEQGIREGLERRNKRAADAEQLYRLFNFRPPDIADLDD